MTDFEKAQALLHEFKGSSYLFGADVLPRVGEQAAAAGKKAALVRSPKRLWLPGGGRCICPASRTASW